MAETIVIAGSLAQRPHHGGHTWVFLQYLLGFKRLGWDVLFLDRLEPDMCTDDSGQSCSLDESPHLQYFVEVMERFGLRDCYSLIYNQGERTVGIPRRQMLERVQNAAFLF